MGITNELKDKVRKASNSVVDKTEEIIGIPKSPKELSKRLVEHLSHQEYTKIAEIIIQEVKKYISKVGLDDVEPINKKLEQFKNDMDDLAANMEEGNYNLIATKFRKIEHSIPESTGKASEVFKTIKNFLRSVAENIEEQSKQGKEKLAKNGVDFSKLQSACEEYFGK